MPFPMSPPADMAPKKKTSKKSAKSPKKKVSTSTAPLKQPADQDLAIELFDPTTGATTDQLREFLAQSRCLGLSDRAQKFETSLKILRAGELIAEAKVLLREICSAGEEFQMHALEGYLEAADAGIAGIRSISIATQRQAARVRTDWPVLLERDSPAYQTEVHKYLKTIDLAKDTTGELKVGLVARQRSPQKELIAELYLVVNAIQRTSMIEGTAISPNRRTTIDLALGRKLASLQKRLNGYPSTEWRRQDVRALADAIKSLPEFSEKSFSLWFKACRALLVCITKNKFHLKRHGLYSMGEWRARKNADRTTLHNEDDFAAERREGITEGLKSMLCTLLKPSRKESLELTGK